ncbi:MAG: PilZ domain-containing protein [Enhygromyxa sp.]
MAESDERRRGERIPINDEFGSGAPGTTWVSDLSLGGVFVHTEELLPVGSMIELRFTVLIDDPVVIEAFGKVVRHSHKPRGMGVQFAAMRPEMTLRIEDVLSRRRPLDSGAPLRLPEPSSAPIEDDDEADDTTNRVVFARPAPVEELGLRRVPKQEFENAVTASFPRVESARQPKANPKAPVFRAPPRPPSKPQARAREIKDEDRTAVYQAVPRKED